jgi:hypothetical protein
LELRDKSGVFHQEKCKKLMLQYHPDKLQGQKPTEEQKLAWDAIAYDCSQSH